MLACLVSPKHCECEAHSRRRNGGGARSIILPEHELVLGGGEKQDIVETQLPSQPALQISELLTTANNNHQWLESISDDHVVHHNSPSPAAVEGIPALVEHKLDIIIMPECVPLHGK